MSYANNYGARGANPFDQREAQSPGYQNGQYGQYNAPTMGRDDYGGQNVEMAPLAQNGAQAGQGGQRQALEKCTAINDEIDYLEKTELPALRMIQQSSLTSADPASTSSALDEKSASIMARYRELVNEVRMLKSSPQSAELRPVGQVDRRLKAAIQQYQSIDNDFSKKSKDQMARQFRIVRPDASEAEVREAVEDPNGGQVFSQAMMQSNRQGQAQSTLNAVKSRHEEIQKIEQQMIQLAELFQDMDVLVQQQEAAVVNIEMKGEEVVDNMDKGNQEVGVAIQSAKNARKWKWWCLGICVLIVIVIAVAIVAKVAADGGFNKSPAPAATPAAAKRWELPVNHRVVSKYSGNGKREPMVVSDDWQPTPNEKRIVVSDDWTPTPNEKREVVSDDWSPTPNEKRMVVSDDWQPTNERREVVSDDWSPSTITKRSRSFQA
ncbi:hypothetical protein HYALB_00011759 [Hymenoscyphus albidus]|uniref:t-SNARE coiled-coil homology domain-containing protein n=1 Tax=Hymenoscyphus albidus TaxID=595503 RepID=A0A9N9Q8P1_9HELO|nr:hypothetical protein HYALB_00011759 [Hymenoscyphus albidus]